VNDAPTLELLAWVSSRPRTYAEAMDAWRTHCPRLTVWEDAVLGGLVRVVRGPDGQAVELTEAGETALATGNRAAPAIV
jgi:hypothetical protein